MNSYLEKVKEFHTNFDHTISEPDVVLDLKIRKQRINLIFEELSEFGGALDVLKTFKNLCAQFIENHPNVQDGDNVNKQEELDALCDIQFVLSGSVLATGHQEYFDEAFEEVFQSNMSKSCKTVEEANSTQKYFTNQGVECYITQKDDFYFVLRTSDNKLLKNIFYKKAELSKFIKK